MTNNSQLIAYLTKHIAECDAAIELHTARGDTKRLDSARKYRDTQAARLTNAQNGH